MTHRQRLLTMTVCGLLIGRLAALIDNPGAMVLYCLLMALFTVNHFPRPGEMT